MRVIFKTSQKFVRYWLPVIIWKFATLAVSTLPGKTVASAGNIPYSSVLAHFAEFLVFSFLLHRALANEKLSTKSALILTLIASFAFSVLTEILQLNIPGRVFDYNDILTNDLGALAGIGRAIYASAA